CWARPPGAPARIRDFSRRPERRRDDHRQRHTGGLVRGSTMRRTAAVLAAAGVLSVGVAACGGGKSKSTAGKPGAGKPAVTLGAKNFPEEFILGQLYTQALRAKG